MSGSRPAPGVAPVGTMSPSYAPGAGPGPTAPMGSQPGMPQPQPQPFQPRAFEGGMGGPPMKGLPPGGGGKSPRGFGAPAYGAPQPQPGMGQPQPIDPLAGQQQLMQARALRSDRR